VLRGNNLAANVGQVNFGPQLSKQWFDWVYARISQNKPYDELAAGIVLGSMRARPDQPYDEYVVEMSSYFRKDGADFGNRETMPWFWARQNVQKPEDKPEPQPMPPQLAAAAASLRPASSAGSISIPSATRNASRSENAFARAVSRSHSQPGIFRAGGGWRPAPKGLLVVHVG
jgi:hypothetical protein